MKSKICIVLFFISFSVFSQDLPPIVKYAPSTYGAGNQNWMISQDESHYIFFANNEGLLEYNGSNWELYPSPNETILRSVKVIGNKVYTGGYMEFGYWTRQSDGKLKYASLSKIIVKDILDDEQFWNISHYDQWVVFQSLDRIYIYDTKAGSFKIITPKNRITKSFSTINSIYFQIENEGLFEIESGKAQLVSNNPILISNRIVNIFATDEGLLIQTQFHGLYRLTGRSLSKFSTEADSEMMANSVYSSSLLSDGSYVIGTVSSGIFILNTQGKIKYHISQNKGLSNNTALSLFEDADKNLWVGLDNGVNCINLQSPIKNFVDVTGKLGTVYSSKLYDGILYIGTNQGLFYKDYLSAEEFKFISGTKGQVWSLFEYDGTLFCGHDSGTLIIENGTSKNIFPKSGTWKFKTVPNQKGILLQGNYSGISVLEKVDNQWRYRNKIAGFDYSARYFEITDAFEIYVSHEYKGVFRLQLDKALLKAKSVTAYKRPEKGKNAGLTKFNNTIYYASKSGVFKLNNKSKLFEKDKFLSSFFKNDEYTSGKLIVDKSNKIWLFSKSYIYYFSLSKLSNQLKQNLISIPAYLTNSMSGFENISQISNYDYLIGTTDGYYTININDLSFKNYKVAISNVATSKLNGNFTNSSIQEAGSLEFDENNIIFNYTVPEYNMYISSEYQYLLEGFQDDWSDWSTKTAVSFKNLPSGRYVFKVRTKFANSVLGNTAAYSFTVHKPWYRSGFALFIYLLIGIVLAQIIHKFSRRYYQKKEDKLIQENNRLLEIKELENEHEMMRVKNEQLSLDVDIKSRELAVSAMSLHNKNELLAFIKEDLKKTNDDKNLKSVISTITKNITGNDSWSVFKEAFENTDKDFLKKIKLAHSSLTPSDLRLCAYLRLNLSSKEIAPLLNISVRSVEIKRYRLRKKMDLSHEHGLVEYILSV
ncbi:triple tyrosine motif-containing protein [Flavobacterium sp. W22_SRS_FP1]|uniref:helix-turn-helix and ligand-binding sensor domain-containing protein n=1 Tax=Flavobacterium sp. W22_SRS_FP1 TaxID=3240276 RepID=UPI003F93F12A